MKWFRFYAESMHDPKVQQLPAELFKTWVNLLCLASQNGGNLGGDENAIAFTLRLRVDVMRKHIQQLKAAGLIEGDGDMRPHNWDGRQYQSDDVSARVKRYRERKKVVTDNVPRNVTKSLAETPPDTDTDSEQSSVAKATGADAPISDQDRLWRDGVPWLAKRSGKSQDKIRPILGKWAKTHGPKRVLEAIALAQQREVIEPIAFITAALSDKAKDDGGFQLRPLGVGG